MSYTCTIYQNSGLNATNTIDNGALLNSLPQITVPALDVVQERLSSITVKATWEQVKNADFCKLSNGTNTIFFAIDGAGITMSATDVAVLPVTLDYFLTYGLGTILDGITERVHVASDDFGEWSGDDSLLTPAEPLQIITHWNDTEAGTYYNVIESTVDPLRTANSKQSISYSSEAGAVDVPNLIYNQTETTYKIGETASGSVGTCVYNVDADGMKQAIATLRSIGVEQAIIRQVKLPSNFVEVGGVGGVYSDITGKVLRISFTNAGDFAYKNTAAKNNRINYSSFTKYGLITCSGASIEADPSEIYDSTQTAPEVRCISDPHLDGRPYYRFRNMNGDTSETGFWRNCVAGLPWKNVPLIYQGASGSALNTLKYDAQQRINAIDLSAQEFAHDQQQMRNVFNSVQAGGAAAQAMNAAGSSTEATVAAAVSTGLSAVGGIGNSILDALKYEQDYKNYRRIYNLSRQSELQSLYINNNVVAPSVNFPYNSETLRDFYGNGVLMYRYKYSDNDVQRIDKLLTMYGYKVSKPLELSDFNNRRYFNFVMCNNVTVGGHAKWINDGISEQLRAGVRIWHELPNNARYTDNPIKGV